MNPGAILLSIDRRGVARVTLNRPERRNALDEALISGARDALARLAAEPGIRAIVLSGAGEAFCAGEDIGMMRRVVDYSAAEKKNDARRLAHLINALDTIEIPTIAIAHGAAISAGAGLLAACDIAIAADDCIFSIADARWGVAPAVIAPYVLRAIGPREARRFFLSAQTFDAETARRIGLAHMIAMRQRLELTLDGLLEDILACGPGAQREAKAIIRAFAYRPISDALIEQSAGMIARIRASSEAREGMSAFLEKTSPSWRKE